MLKFSEILDRMRNMSPAERVAFLRSIGRPRWADNVAEVFGVK